MSLEDTCFEIVQANEFRDTPEGVKSAFMTADEALNVLVPDHFFVGMARVGKDQFEEPGPMVAAIFLSGAPFPKSTCASSPAAVWIRAKSFGVLAFSFLT